MKKDEHLVAKVALGTYVFVLGVGLVLNNWTEKASKNNELLKIEMSRKITIYKWQGNTQWSAECEDSYGCLHFLGYHTYPHSKEYEWTVRFSSCT